MFEILTLNKISPVGTMRLDKDLYNITSESAKPDGVILRSFSMHEMELPESLLAVARAGAGVNNIPLDKCAEKGIVVFNTPGANANAVKELVIAGLLLASRKIIDGVNWAKTLKGQEGVGKLVEKGKSNYAGNEIKGKKIAVIGLGAIGVLVANACDALGMEVIGYDPYLSTAAALKLNSSVKVSKTIEGAYKDADFMSLHLPLLDSTRGMINKESLEGLKDGIKILNFSRGELVDSKDIIEAVGSKKVASYVTDFPNDEQVDVEGIIAIPHLGASTEESEDNCAIMAADEIKEYLEFGNIKNSVNYPDCELAYSGKKRVCVLAKNSDDISVEITKAIATKGLTLAGSSFKQKGDYSYSIVDFSDNDTKNIKDDFSKISGVIKVREV